MHLSRGAIALLLGCLSSRAGATEPLRDLPEEGCVVFVVDRHAEIVGLPRSPHFSLGSFEDLVAGRPLGAAAFGDELVFWARDATGARRRLTSSNFLAARSAPEAGRVVCWKISAAPEGSSPCPEGGVNFTVFENVLKPLSTDGRLDARSLDAEAPGDEQPTEVTDSSGVVRDGAGEVKRDREWGGAVCSGDLGRSDLLP